MVALLNCKASFRLVLGGWQKAMVELHFLPPANYPLKSQLAADGVLHATSTMLCFVPVAKL